MAEQPSPVDEKQERSALLWEIVQTFSNEAQIAAKKKATEQGYALDKGDVPFEETLINLSRNRDILLKSIEDAALPQLPLKIQNVLISDSRKVSANLSALLSGTDAVIPFSSAVDDLTANIWFSNLQNMSGQVLGLQEKLNQLKTLEKALRDLGHRADSFKISEQRAADGLARLDEALIAVEGSVGNLTRVHTEGQQQLDLIKALEQKSTASLLAAQQSEKSSSESAATTRAASGEVDSLRTRAATSFAELDNARAAFSSLNAELSALRAQVETAIKLTQETQKRATKISTSDHKQNLSGYRGLQRTKNKLYQLLSMFPSRQVWMQ